MTQHHDGRTRVTRESGTYVIDGLTPSDRPVRFTFPSQFPDAPELAGKTVDGTCFATRETSTHPLWCDFKHPIDGRWRSVLVREEWVDATITPPQRAAFKRPR